MTKWTDFAKAFASKHNISYKEALSKCKEEYYKSKGTVEEGKISAKWKKTIKGGVLNSPLMNLPDIAFVNVVESIGNFMDLQNFARGLQDLINEGGLTELELELVTNRLAFINARIQALMKTPPSSPTSYKRGDSPPPPPPKEKRRIFSLDDGANKKIK